jgi:hypothetical protein
VTPPFIAELLGMLIEEQVIITRAPLADVSMEFFFLKQSLPLSPPCKRSKYQTIDGFSYH